MTPFLTAEYRNGRVRIGGKTYAAGAYAVHLLNQFYKNDTAERLSVYKQHGWNVAEQLSAGYLKEDDLIGAGEEIGHILDVLPALKPFDRLDVPAERKRISDLFSTEQHRSITGYFRRRAAVERKEQVELDLHLLPQEYDKALFQSAAATIADITDTLAFYNAISDDMHKAHRQLSEFTASIVETARLDEEHLLPVALEIFGSAVFPVRTEYVPQQKNAKSPAAVVARKLYFDRYYSFVVTDFFEGLHFGHYPRRCEICGNYFLMTSARRQQYCNGTAPYEVRGKKVTCRKYAASIHRKELAAADPVIAVYTRRCGAIRTEKGRKTISEEFARAAKALAKEYKLRAQQDAEYAKRQYLLDMSRERLYAETDRRLK